MKLTQKQLIIDYIKEYGKITPAKMSGKIYKGIMIGSQVDKRCREIRQSGYNGYHIYSLRAEKFTSFYLKASPKTFNEKKELETLQKPLFNFKKQY